MKTLSIYLFLLHFSLFLFHDIMNFPPPTPSQNSLTSLRVKPRSLSHGKTLTRALKRFLKLLCGNALKLASNLLPRSSDAAAAASPPPPRSFCDEAQEENVEELREVFKYLDADGDGKISWAELHSALNSVGHDHVGENELREVIKQLDCEAEGCLDVHGFLGLNCEERDEEEVEKELAAAFRMFEGSSKGITPAGLQRMMCRLGVENGATLEDCTFIISQVDLDGDGVVSFTEFKHMMTAAVH